MKAASLEPERELEEEALGAPADEQAVPENPPASVAAKAEAARGPRPGER